MWSFFSGISFVDKLLFTKHLAVMIKSGIPLVEAIQAIGDQSSSPRLKQVLEAVTAEIENGGSLHESLAKHPQVFDALYVSLVTVGEQSGNLEESLEYLAEHLRKVYEFRKRVQGAMLYPMIVIIGAAGVGGFASFYVMPKLIDLFESLDVELPLTTKILLWLAYVVRDYNVWIVAGAVGLMFAVWLLLRVRVIKYRYQQLLFSLPVLGSFLQQVQLALLCRNMGMMLKSGLPIAQALQTQEAATDNLIFKDYLSNLGKSVDKGRSLVDELQHNHYRYIPKVTMKIVGMGEETGNLDEALLYLASFFEEEVDNVTKNLSTVLEPLLLIMIGLVVAFVALAIISPVYDLVGGIRR